MMKPDSDREIFNLEIPILAQQALANFLWKLRNPSRLDQGQAR